MSCEHTISVEECLWRVTVRGQDTFMERIGRLNEIISDPKWRPGANILEDCRDLTVMNMDISEIFKITEIHVVKDDMIGDGRLAIVTGLGTVGSILQMWKINTENRVLQKIRVFHDMDSAKEWLNGNGHC